MEELMILKFQKEIENTPSFIINTLGEKETCLDRQIMRSANFKEIFKIMKQLSLYG